MALNPSIILAGQTPDVLGAMNQGRAMAESQIGMNRQNALAELYRTQGAGIAAGDQNALNALAGMDPMASLGVQDARLGMDQTRLQMDATKQDMQFSAEKMAMLREESKREAAAALAEQASTLTAEQLAAESAALSEALTGGAFFYQNKDRAGYDAFLASKGLDPAEFPFEAFPAHAASVEGVLDAMKTFAPPEGPEWRPATPEEAAARGATAGQISDKTGEFKRTPVDSSMVIETLPGGGTRVVQGPGAADSGKMKPSDPALMIASIDGILKDPALDYSTGMMAPLQYIPGTPMKRFQTRAKQLEGQAFLQAFESLKGAGQITEVEGIKATQAIGRLDTAQSAEDYRQALLELREVLSLAATRPVGWAATQEGAAQGAAPAAPGAAVEMSDEDFLKAMGLE